MLLGFTVALTFMVIDILAAGVWIIQAAYAAGWWVSPHVGYWLFGRWMGRPSSLYKGAGRILHDWIIGDAE